MYVYLHILISKSLNKELSFGFERKIIIQYTVCIIQEKM